MKTGPAWLQNGQLQLMATVVPVISPVTSIHGPGGGVFGRVSTIVKFDGAEMKQFEGAEIVWFRVKSSGSVVPLG